MSIFNDNSLLRLLKYRLFDYNKNFRINKKDAALTTTAEKCQDY